MPGNPNQPDLNSRRPVPEQNQFGTTGEFTQIFAASGPSPSSAPPAEQAPLASTDDEFAKLFLSSAKPAGLPAQQEQRVADATLIFEALPAMPKTSTPAAVQEQPAAAVLRHSEESTANSPRHLSPSGSEFTQVFSPVVPPSTPMPATAASVRPPTPPLSEFTQFFSAISAREALSPSPPLEIAQQAQHSASPSASSATHDPFSQKSEAVRPSAFDIAPLSPADSLTQVFHQGPAISASSRNTVQTPPAASSVAPSESFTQIFQQIAPPPVRRDPSGSLSSSIPSAPPVPPPHPASQLASPQAWPAFGPPPPAEGSFTDVFAAQRPQPSSAPTPRPGALPLVSVPAAQNGGFTELFQAVPAQPQPSADQSPFSNFGMPGAQGVGMPGWPSALSAPSSNQDALMAVGGGDFTRLMQSVAANPQGNPASSATNDAFFAPSASSASQESEYTRVQRASQQREAGGAATPVAAPAAAAAAPGLAMAAPKEKSAEKEASPKKSKTLVILLVAMNVLLLLALLIIGFLVLRRK